MNPTIEKWVKLSLYLGSLIGGFSHLYELSMIDTWIGVIISGTFMWVLVTLIINVTIYSMRLVDRYYKDD